MKDMNIILHIILNSLYQNNKIPSVSDIVKNIINEGNSISN